MFFVVSMILVVFTGTIFMTLSFSDDEIGLGICFLIASSIAFTCLFFAPITSQRTIERGIATCKKANSTPLYYTPDYVMCKNGAEIKYIKEDTPQ